VNEAAEYQALVGKVVLGRYRVARLLAIGGMGVIYLARGEGAAGFVRPVTVKRILPAKGSAEALVRGFAREARILSNLRHPGIVGIIDFREEDGAYLMVLEYVHGFDLGKWYRFVQATRRRFPVDLAVQMVIAMLEALHYAHTLRGPDAKPLNIVHRDVSPSNLLVDTEGHVKLTDFGIARMQAAPDEFRTEEGKIRGKFHYLAPELFSRADPSAATDVFSAGVVLHELLAGVNEFKADDFQSTVARVLGHQLSPLEKLRPDVPAALTAVINKATAKLAAERYASAAEFAEALRAARTRTAEDVARELKSTVGKDFLDPRMPMMLGVEPLHVLEKAWKSPPQAPSLPPPPATPAEPEPPTAVEVSKPVALVRTVPSEPPVEILSEPPQAKASRPRTSLVVALALAVGAGLGALAWWRFEPTPPTRFVLVEGDVTAVGPEGARDAAAAPEASPAPTPPGELAVAATATQSALAAALPARPATPENNLTRTFAKEQARVERCFTEHAAGLELSSQVALRFRVDRAGKVEQAELIPPALSDSPLGSCLLGLAKEIAFGPQPRALTFRIPVTVRTGG
jgi:serine/threonine-protein kinase